MLELDSRSKLEEAAFGFSVRTDKPKILERPVSHMPTAYVVDTSLVDTALSMSNRRVVASEIPQIPGKTLIHDPRVFIDFNNPLTHDGGSQFKYPGEQRWNDDILMVSMGAPFSETSAPHWHLPDKHEFYRKLYGKAWIKHHEVDPGYEVPDSFVVQPGVRHQIITKEDPVIFMLLMKGAHLLPEDLRHIR